MTTAKKDQPASALKRRIWRISSAAPFGKFVDTEPQLPQTLEAADAPEHIEPGWRQSSFDLAFGLDVRDAGDTVPAEFWDDLFDSPAR